MTAALDVYPQRAIAAITAVALTLLLLLLLTLVPSSRQERGAERARSIAVYDVITVGSSADSSISERYQAPADASDQLRITIPVPSFMSLVEEPDVAKEPNGQSATEFGMTDADRIAPDGSSIFRIVMKPKASKAADPTEHRSEAKLLSWFVMKDDFVAAPNTFKPETVLIRYEVQTNGRVARCNPQRAVETGLAARICSLIVRRFIFEPATDARGDPVTEIRNEEFVWVPPAKRTLATR